VALPSRAGAPPVLQATSVGAGGRSRSGRPPTASAQRGLVAAVAGLVGTLRISRCATGARQSQGADLVATACGYKLPAGRGSGVCGYAVWLRARAAGAGTLAAPAPTTARGLDDLESLGHGRDATTGLGWPLSLWCPGWGMPAGADTCSGDRFRDGSLSRGSAVPGAGVPTRSGGAGVSRGGRLEGSGFGVGYG
jgi:hypothetical protein